MKDKKWSEDKNEGKMPSKDITPVLKSWEYEAGTINVRKISGLDGSPIRAGGRFDDPRLRGYYGFARVELRPGDGEHARPITASHPGGFIELVRWADLIDSAAFPDAAMAVARREPRVQRLHHRPRRLLPSLRVQARARIESRQNLGRGQLSQGQ